MIAIIRPSYLPEVIKDASLFEGVTELLKARKAYKSHRFEGYTDQIDVYLNGRKIATYVSEDD